MFWFSKKRKKKDQNTLVCDLHQTGDKLVNVVQRLPTEQSDSVF